MECARVEIKLVVDIAQTKINAADGDQSQIDAIRAALKIERANINIRKAARIAEIHRM